MNQFDRRDAQLIIPEIIHFPEPTPIEELIEPQFIRNDRQEKIFQLFCRKDVQAQLVISAESWLPKLLSSELMTTERGRKTRRLKLGTISGSDLGKSMGENIAQNGVKNVINHLCEYSKNFCTRNATTHDFTILKTPIELKMTIGDFIQGSTASNKVPNVLTIHYTLNKNKIVRFCGCPSIHCGCNRGLIAGMSIGLHFWVEKRYWIGSGKKNNHRTALRFTEEDYVKVNYGMCCGSMEKSDAWNAKYLKFVDEDSESIVCGSQRNRLSEIMVM